MNFKKIVTLIGGIALFVNYNFAQNVLLGKISPDKGQVCKGIAGQIGNYIYTTSFKGKDLYINKCSIETLEIESSQKISTGNMDLKENSWEVLKVGDKIVFIIAVWDKLLPNKIFGKTIVESDGKVNAEGELKLITEWASPEYKGERLVLTRDIQIKASPEVEGLSTLNGKIVVYFIHMLQRNSLYKHAKSISFLIINKDLNKLDEQHVDFDEKEKYYLQDLKMDVDGNFYLIERGYDSEHKENHFYSLIYDYKKKEIKRKELFFDKLNKGDKIMSLQNLSIDGKNNLMFTSFIGPYQYVDAFDGEYCGTSANFCAGDININGEINYDIIPFDKNLFSKPLPDMNSKNDRYYSKVSISTSPNHIIVYKRNEGVKKNIPTHIDILEYVILKKGENSKYKIVNNYISDIGYSSGLSETIEPTFIEGKDKLFMVFAPLSISCKSLNLDKPSDRVCLVNTFDFKGNVKTSFLFNVEKMNPEPINDYRLKDGNYVFSEKKKQVFFKLIAN